ncbi:MAG: hypothetical protein AUJ28_03825 [Parcubacteria group bacterium CG1_02_37_51]|uniref:Uncharacterized protein n=2 Tax=Candidatus Komeiliibacteriota TaxID=1817908 RepID=A0A2M7RAM2_9BACT|nr:MAG: hypothetical protein AUJ28_03825 [Parcubacteria group bacterium CG1_02_37_51]PIY93790.1 MAG: hypothetical protein COY67_03585 [Candidatus Komeilibacteria bacterium CG_4_10_14_0_8_um_filter_37_78]
MKKIMNKKLLQVALMQSLGLAIYCAIVASLIWFLDTMNVEPPGFSGIVFFLFLLVFSAAVCGLLFFGYAANLALNKRMTDAVAVVGYTIGFCMILLAIVLAVVFALT